MTRSLAELALCILVAGCGGEAAITPAPPEPASAEPTTPPRRTPGPVPTAGPFPSGAFAGLDAEGEVPFTETVDCGTRECVVPADILAPSAGANGPTVVLLPGGPVPFHERRYLEDLAVALAERGSVVLIGSYRSPSTGNPDADTLADARCIVSFARSVATERGGDGDRVVLAGHSFGSDLALRSLVSPEEENTGCLADGEALPDAIVAIAGFSVQISGAEVREIPVTLIGGSDDELVRGGAEYTERLAAAGFDAAYHEMAGADHGEVVDPAVTPEVVDLILQAGGE